MNRPNEYVPYGNGEIAISTIHALFRAFDKSRQSPLNCMEANVYQGMFFGKSRNSIPEEELTIHSYVIEGRYATKFGLKWQSQTRPASYATVVWKVELDHEFIHHLWCTLASEFGKAVKGDWPPNHYPIGGHKDNMAFNRSWWEFANANNGAAFMTLSYKDPKRL